MKRIITPEDYIFETNDFRISFLSKRLFRIEKGNYLDDATQVIIDRSNHETFKIDFLEIDDLYVFETDEIKVFITHSGIVNKIIFKDDNLVVTEFKKGNLKGTARTLDGVNGSCKLHDGIISKDGVAILDDSKSLVLINDELFPRKECSDLYFFAFKDDYRAALKAFYKLTGNVPLIPRYALGNWWSRYHAYTDEEYENLILDFEKHEIPISVSVIDMDWHYVDNYKEFKDDSLFSKEELNNPRTMALYYDGWTGYTWNKHLFKDYRKFLNFLHDHNLKVTLNLHPGLGVRKYEDAFVNMANALNIDPSSTRIIPFDIASKSFIKAYLDVLHHPYEEEGVDFWWIDWQQGETSKMKNLDPLWALNHYHYYDNDRGNNRPLILSRYGGPGSHRYPLGFSGDTHMTWESLKFQPYFTSTATNIGYIWWSHDIGGHMGGYKDNELYLRWLQLGVFSPINRLHSTSNEFTGKEPWKYIPSVEQNATYYLQLRKRLIPYLYSMNYLAYKDGKALVEPMYYSYKNKEAYQIKNQFMFGTELMVSPITSKTNKTTNLAKAKTWMPEGTWVDIFTNRIYQGNQIVDIYRTMDYIPVFAKSGAIIPLYVDGKTNNLDNNQDLEILVYHGNNVFTLYEDDGTNKDYNEGVFSVRKLNVSANANKVIFEINPNSNVLCDLTYNRNLYISFKDIVKAHVKCNVDYEIVNKEFVCIKVKDCSKKITIELDDCDFLKNKEFKEATIDLISTYQMGNDKKIEMFSKTLIDKTLPENVSSTLLGPIKELLKLK